MLERRRTKLGRSTAFWIGSAALAAIACARAPSVGTTTTTAARSVSRPDAVMQLAHAACDGASTCGEPSADTRDCVREAAERADFALPSAACPRGADAARLATCVKLVEAAACDVGAERSRADPLVRPGCVGAGLCPAR